jgi:hypothetical protein
MNDFQTGVSVFQRFSEFFLKENLMKPEKSFDEGYNFEKVNSILADIIRLISPETITYIDEYCYGRPSFAISWILTLFTHNILDSAVQFRLFDYFITSHPVTIFYLTAVIVIEETLKLAKGNRYLVWLFFNFYDEGDFFMHFQGLQMDKLNYDHYIQLAEEAMKKFPHGEVMKKYVEQFKFKEL